MSTREKIIRLLDLLTEDELVLIHKTMKFLRTYRRAADEHQDQAIV